MAQERRQGWFIRLLKIIRNPLVILLAALSAISFATGDARAGTVMAAMVVLSVALRFLQEARADAAAAKLKAMIHVTATVIRDGAAREMPLRDLVPGDIIKLSAGDMIPGDVRVLSSKDLFVSQGSLTGESFPVEKFHDADTEGRDLTDRAQEHLLHGDQRRKRHGDRGRGHHRSPHLSRQHGGLDHGGARADQLRSGPQPLHLAHDPAHGGDGAAGLPHQRVHQARLERAPFSSPWPWPWVSLRRCCP